jgi:hypothetical protein
MDGRPKVAEREMRAEVFRRVSLPHDSSVDCDRLTSIFQGLTQGVRRKVWPYILGVVPWDTNTDEREALWEEKRQKYQEVYNEWCGVADVFNRDDVVEVRGGIYFFAGLLNPILSRNDIALMSIVVEPIAPNPCLRRRRRQARVTPL